MLTFDHTNICLESSDYEVCGCIFRKFDTKYEKIYFLHFYSHYF